jgi:hypothetical protein
VLVGVGAAEREVNPAIGEAGFLEQQRCQFGARCAHPGRRDEAQFFGLDADRLDDSRM